MRTIPAPCARPEHPGMFRSVGGDIAVRDVRDPMAQPSFTLAKSRSGRPFDVPMGEVSLPAKATAGQGVATICGADVHIRVASRIVEVRDDGRIPLRIIAAAPHEIPVFARRSTGKVICERSNTGRSPQLTDVMLVWQDGQREDWLKFGKPVASRIIDRRRRIESYAAGQVFGLVRWASNEYGTVRSTLDIVRTVEAGESCTPVAQVDPGGEVLLSVHGWPKVAQVFRLIDAIEASGIDPCEVAPDHWRHIHNRLAGRERPREYSPARHRAWLKRKALLP